MKKINILSLAFLFIFVVILVSVVSNNFNFLEKIDLSINQAIPAIQNAFFTEIAKAFAFIFDTYSMIVISAIIVAILFFKKYKKEAGFFALLMIINAGAIYVLKEIVGRARPLNSIISSSGFAFPSGHAATAAVFFGLLCYLALKSRKTKKLKIWTLVLSSLLVLLIVFSRIYLNVHWLSDVVGGLFLGAFILLFGISIKEIFE